MQASKHIEKIQPPPITEVKNWLAEQTFSADKPLVDLCQAVPSYSPPAELIQHLKSSLDDPATFKYSPDEGLPEVRQEVCAWYQRHYQGAPKPEQLCLSIGASQAFWLAVSTLCRPGDEVIIQLPAYFDHLMGLQALDIKPVYAPFDPANAGQPDLQTISRLINSKTRAILLVTPSNPTGAVIPAEQINAFFELAEANSISLILDETYNAFIGTAPHFLFNRSDWSHHFIQIASFGKTFALTGLRCGALIADQDFIQQALKVQDSMAVCQPRTAQLALKFGCQHLDGWIAKNGLIMRQRHDDFKTAFQGADTGFELIASGSFFAWVKHPWRDLTGRQAARRLVAEEHLICLPGEAFGPGLESYLRLSFGNIESSQIPEAVARLQQG
ncbi:aminotransferase [uncultured Desulfuromusa sp.]|uniref:aminotransferase n=1 Tax=uncultured Desulfuromusa sp. TaxID=219183 RepID=UPI002AA8AD97|nr:aminotransferase [uncultured Desulfuromusa sp.]